MLIKLTGKSDDKKSFFEKSLGNYYTKNKKHLNTKIISGEKITQKNKV